MTKPLRQFYGREWNTEGETLHYVDVDRALMQEIRDELVKMNGHLRVLSCPNFLGIPHTLTSIRRKLPNKKKAKRTR